VNRLGKAALVGVGAVGGSVAGALRARGLAAEVWAFDPANAVAARDAGLVCDDHHRKARLVGPANQIEDATDKLHLINPMHVAMIDVDDAIAV
jgi:prephenate dehydrogenase